MAENYVAGYDDPAHRDHREALRIADWLRNDTAIADGVITWKSNGNVPFENAVALAAHLGLPVDVAKCTRVRDEQTDRSIAAYRERMKGHTPSAEERAEARAAHGSGVTLVNVITGEKFTT